MRFSKYTSKRAEILHMYDNGNGLSIPEIAKITGVPHGVVHTYCIQFPAIQLQRERLSSYLKEKGIDCVPNCKDNSSYIKRTTQAKHELSQLILSRLDELGKDVEWMAQRSGLEFETLQSYIHERRLPLKFNLEVVYTTLNVPPEMQLKVK